ncbi:MAG TPA: hypothetical protein VKZ18_23290 [Polyangia bacterium]|nr:hypothetical protein [Polyangia bacterium]
MSGVLAILRGRFGQDGPAARAARDWAARTSHDARPLESATAALVSRAMGTIV